MAELEKIFDFLHAVENLKSTLRYNLTKTGRRESTAEHTWRLALSVIVVAKELNLDVDVDHAVKMALVHDLPEAIVGDIDAVKIAQGEVTSAEKQKKEKESMEQIKGLLPESLGVEIYDLWQEYEDCTTNEARFIKALDKIETLTQLAEIGHEKYDVPDFIPNYADAAVKAYPELCGMLEIVKRKLKHEYDKGGIPWKEEYGKID
jgi:putative hydrolase of HD superfamily